jgi:hypothetical protein
VTVAPNRVAAPQRSPCNKLPTPKPSSGKKLKRIATPGLTTGRIPDSLDGNSGETVCLEETEDELAKASEGTVVTPTKTNTHNNTNSNRLKSTSPSFEATQTLSFKSFVQSDEK